MCVLTVAWMYVATICADTRAEVPASGAAARAALMAVLVVGVSGTMKPRRAVGPHSSASILILLLAPVHSRPFCFQHMVNDRSIWDHVALLQ